MNFEGKKVKVEWENLEPIEGVVLSSPCATGDCWEIETAREVSFTQEIVRSIVKVQTFSRMTFVENNP